MSIQRDLQNVIVQRNQPVKDDYNRANDNYLDDHQSEVAIYGLTGGIMVNMSLLVHDSTHQGLSPDKSIERGMRIVTDSGKIYYVDDADTNGRLNQMALKRIEGLHG